MVPSVTCLSVQRPLRLLCACHAAAAWLDCSDSHRWLTFLRRFSSCQLHQSIRRRAGTVLLGAAAVRGDPVSAVDRPALQLSVAENSTAVFRDDVASARCSDAKKCACGQRCHRQRARLRALLGDDRQRRSSADTDEFRRVLLLACASLASSWRSAAGCSAPSS